MINGNCSACGTYQVYNGYDCVCQQGYVLNSYGVCAVPVVPTCQANQVYNYSTQSCVCINNYQMIYGQCQYVPACPTNSVWNGAACTCGLGLTMINGACVTQTVPTCQAQATFNGISCACNPGFYEVYKGFCGTCARGWTWDGSQCRQGVSPCAPGYSQDPYTGVCTSNPTVIINPGQVCPANAILVSGQCVCQPGYYMIGGSCTVCPSGTTWNGSICQITTPTDSSQWCIGKPFTYTANGYCVCQSDFTSINHVCVKNH